MSFHRWPLLGSGKFRKRKIIIIINIIIWIREWGPYFHWLLMYALFTHGDVHGVGEDGEAFPVPVPYFNVHLREIFHSIL